MEKYKCPCNCHQDWWTEMGMEKHRNCGECFVALLEEEIWFKNVKEEDLKEIKERLGI